MQSNFMSSQQNNNKERKERKKKLKIKDQRREQWSQR